MTNTHSLIKGALLQVTGIVQKVVKREGKFTLVISSILGYTVFADCVAEVERVSQLRVKKGSQVALSGIVTTFGASAVNLADCKFEMFEINIKPER